MRKVSLIVVSGALIVLAGIFIWQSSSASPLHAMGSVLRQTETAHPVNSPIAEIKLSIRTDKMCYLTDEPIQMWIELFNPSSRPITVLKPLRIFTANAYQGVLPLVNGIHDKAQITILDDKLPGESEYTSLSPNELTAFYISDFWQLTASFRSLPEIPDIPVNSYQLAVEYRNLIPGIPQSMNILPDHNDVEFLYEASHIWTGILYSNVVTVDVVKSQDDCQDRLFIPQNIFEFINFQRML